MWKYDTETGVLTVSESAQGGAKLEWSVKLDVLRTGNADIVGGSKATVELRAPKPTD